MRKSSEWSWDYITSSRKVTSGPCELAYAHLVPSGAVTATYLYHGSNTTGTVIIALVSAAVTGMDFKPKHPVYLPRGLHVEIGANTTGVFVQWRNVAKDEE